MTSTITASSLADALFGLTKKSPKAAPIFANWFSSTSDAADPEQADASAFPGSALSSQPVFEESGASASALLWLGSPPEATPATSRLLTYVAMLFGTPAASPGHGSLVQDWFSGATESSAKIEGKVPDVYSYLQGQGIGAGPDTSASASSETAANGGLFELLRFVKAGPEPLPLPDTRFDSIFTNTPAPLNGLGQPANILFPGLLFKPAAVETFLLV